MMAFAITATFAAFDWLMSLDPHWFSTIYGVYFFSGCMVGFFCPLNLGGYRSSATGVPPRVDHDRTIITTSESTCSAFVFFWGYIAFSQYLLIWYANIPEETGWYLVRQNGGWQWVSLALLFGHFIVPFIGLMSRGVRRNKTALACWAVFVLLMHWLDLYWLVMPQLSAEGLPFGVMDVFCFVGFVCIYGGTCLAIAARHSLLPVKDPRLPESLAFHNI